MYLEEIANIDFEEVLNDVVKASLEVLGAIILVLLSFTFAWMVWDFITDVVAKLLELLGHNRPEVEEEIQSPRPKRAQSQRPTRSKSPKPNKNVKIRSKNVNGASGYIGDVNG